MRFRTFLVLVGLLLIVFSYTSAQVPQLINYQGKLTTSTGAPVNDTLPIIFSIYADEGGTILLWTETQGAVVVDKGIFNVLLGSVNPIGNSVFDGSVRYLGVKVEADPEITPRKLMVSVPYAFRSAIGAPDNDWAFSITDGGDTTLITGGSWGIARAGNILFGNADSTHVNLGVACTTGSSGGNSMYCTVAGGVNNTASYSFATVAGGIGNTAAGGSATVGGGWGGTAGSYATIGGGCYNTANSNYSTIAGGFLNSASQAHATIGGGERNSASYVYATIAGGSLNTASNQNATVGGGSSNVASGAYATVPGGKDNYASGDYSFAAGKQVKIDSSADCTFAFGNSFTTSASHAVIFHDTNTPIKVGIGTTSPQRALHISDVLRLEPRATAPASPSEGDIYVDSANHHIYCYLSGVWKQLDN